MLSPHFPALLWYPMYCVVFWSILVGYHTIYIYHAHDENLKHANSFVLHSLVSTSMYTYPTMYAVKERRGIYKSSQTLACLVL